MRTRRRRRKSDGPGRTRIKLAKILSEELGVEVLPENIWQNNYPAAKWLDLARWGVDANIPGLGNNVNVHSWDTMGEIVKKGVAIVSRESTGIEVCSK
jgi:hypothetical protein